MLLGFALYLPSIRTVRDGLPSVVLQFERAIGPDDPDHVLLSSRPAPRRARRAAT